MIKNNVYYELFASIQVPNHEEVGYWVDLGADPHGNIIKFFDKTINRWVKLTDASSEYATPPYIGNNGNWFIENRDSGVPAAGKKPYIGDDNNWYVFVPSENKYVNTGIMAKGLSAYEIAVKHGFKGTEEEWLQSIKQPALDAAVTALEAAKKANDATEDAKEATEDAIVATENAQNAADRSNEIADNPPKIVDEVWYMYDETTKEYKSTGIKAIGDPFEIKKTYRSIAEMEADYDNPMIGVGQFVWINTLDVEDPDDSKLFLKGTEGWILVGDLSGSQGIQGLSAYEVAVENGYVGTEKEWIQSLKQPALDAAAEALEAKAQVEATEEAVKAAEALRVIAEESRVTAETTRESNEATRKSNENARIAAENIRKTAEDKRISDENIRNTNENVRKDNEAARVSNENTRQTNESTRSTNETQRIANETAREEAETDRDNAETARDTAETERIANENARKTAETGREEAETTREENEAVRVANEATRELQEAARQTNTADAINAVNQAKTAAETATTNANTAASNANTQANRAKEYSDNPPKIENDRWWVWDEVNDTYVNTEVFATGEPGKSPIIQDGTWWVYNNETSEYQDTLIPVTTPYQLTKEKVEAVLTGEIKSHHHDGFYYTEYEIDQKVATINSEFDNYLSKDNTEEFIPTDDYNPATKKYVDSEITKVNAIVDTKIDKTSAGVANGIAQLDLTGKVPASQLPSFVDDVLEFDSVTAFPEEGEAGKIYIAVDTNITYRWSGTQYTMISSSLLTETTGDNRYVKKDGIDNIIIRTSEGSNKNVTYGSTGIRVTPNPDAANNIGISWVKQDGSSSMLKIGAVTNGDVTEGSYTYMGWTDSNGSAWSSSNNLTVGKDKFTYKNINVTLSNGSVPFSSYAVIQNDSNKWISFKSADGTEVGYIGYMKSTTDGDGMWLRNQNTGNTLRLLDDGRFTYKGNDVYHAGNRGEIFPTSHSLILSNSKNKQTIRVDGDKNTFYPVHIQFFEAASQLPIKCWVLKALGSLSPDWEGNHSSGSSSCIVGWEFRAAGWDGNGNIIETISNVQPYVKLVTRVNPGFYSWKGLMVWLRGGTASYEIVTDNEIKSINCTNSSITVGNDTFNPILREDSANQNGGNISDHSLPNKVNEAPDDGKTYIRKNKAWIEADMKSTMAYWYENNENQSTTVLNTGGNRDVIESLRSKFKRCIAKPYGDDAALISFCNETNSNIWPDGSQITVDGGRKENRMTYFPKYYHKTVEMSSGVWRTYISEMQLDDDYIEEPEMLLSTFEAYNNNGVLYSGSGLTSTASQTIATFVTQAKANGPLWGIGDYRSHVTIARMFCAYYGTTNISTANSSIPCSGGTKRYDNGKTGGTLSLGNVDGKTAVNGDASYYSTNFLGLEDCYYSKWEFVQGVNVLSGKWVVYDGGSFPDKDVTDLEAAGATNIRIAGNAVYNASTNGSGWIKKISHGRYGDVVPTELGGSDSTYYADYYWYNTGNKIVLRSGYSGSGSLCGVFLANANYASSHSGASIGSRLAFYGKIVVVDSDDFKKTQS